MIVWSMVSCVVLDLPQAQSLCCPSDPALYTQSTALCMHGCKGSTALSCALVGIPFHINMAFNLDDMFASGNDLLD